LSLLDRRRTLLHQLLPAKYHAAVNLNQRSTRPHLFHGIRSSEYAADADDGQ
jgi:hypothetical protein